MHIFFGWNGRGEAPYWIYVRLTKKVTRVYNKSGRDISI